MGAAMTQTAVTAVAAGAGAGRSERVDGPAARTEREGEAKTVSAVPLIATATKAASAAKSNARLSDDGDRRPTPADVPRAGG